MKARLIKSKIDTAHKTKKLTKAMENISSIKMNKYFKQLLAVNSYYNLCDNILSNMSEEHIENHKYVKRENIGLAVTQYKPDELLVVISSDKGLCGSYNYKIMGEINKFLAQTAQTAHSVDVICIGKKGANYVVNKGQNLIGLYLNTDRENISYLATELSQLISQKYLQGMYAKVSIIYTNYISGLVQETKTEQLLPMEVAYEPENRFELIEQDKIELLDTLILELLETKIAKFLTESITCENIARASSMKNATDSAGSLIDDLTVMYNKSRQSMVTQEIIESSNGATGSLN